MVQESALTLSPAALIAHLTAKGLVESQQGRLPAEGSAQCRLIRDSREAAADTVFFAYQGVAVDSHTFLDQVVEAGAPLVVHDGPFTLPSECEDRCLALRVTNSRAAWAEAWSFACGEPGAALTLLGITGTNGKSSVAWMTHALLRAAGRKGLLLGTIGAKLVDEDIPLRHTTPDPEVLYPLLKRAVDAGCEYAVMEVASHAIAQDKLAALRFGYAGFTSFSRDHLDLHGNLAAYFATKAQLFGQYATSAPVPNTTALASTQRAFVHSSVWPRLSRQLGEDHMERVVAYGGGDEPLRYSPEPLQYSHQGLSFEGTEVSIRQGDDVLLEPTKVPLVTEFQLANLTLALAFADAVRSELATDATPWHQLMAGLSLAVPGRMESVARTTEDQPLVVIDYAHTPDAVAKALQALRELNATQVTVIVGCGGDRDPGKRPLMAKAAINGADAVVFTTDNPRSEAPLAILADMTEGLDLSKDSIDVVVDRREAIGFAIRRAAADEVILLAGKGHESYQEVAGKRSPFDEVAIVQAAFADRAAKGGA